MSALTSKKQSIFYLIIVSIPFVVVLLAFLLYQGYRKMTYSYDYCGSYGQFDGELGWLLKKNASSCLSLKNHLRGIVYFDTTIYTNNGGFRDARPNNEVPKRAIMAIGDSWTFGYGVNYEESYPHFLSQELNAPVINAGIPAYGPAGILLLLTRNVQRYAPSVVVYYVPGKGIYDRSFCTKAGAETALVPCFYYDADTKRIVLATPKDGVVVEAVRNHIYPGGSLTAGYDSLIRFILFVKIPQAATEHILNLSNLIWPKQPGIIPGGTVDPVTNYSVDLRQYELQQYAALSKKHDFAFVLVDPKGVYERIVTDAAPEFAGGIAYIGRRQWRENVVPIVQSMSEDEAWVPMDRHFGRGQNRVIGAEIAKLIREQLADRLRGAR